MKHIFCSRNVIFAALLAACVMPVDLPAQSKGVTLEDTVFQTSMLTDHSLSRQRMEAIQTVLDSYANGDYNLDAPAVRRGIEIKIGREMPVQPQKKLLLQTVGEINALIQVKLDEKYGETFQKRLVRAAEQEAAAKYPLTKPKEKVSFKYERNRKIFQVEGVLHRINPASIEVIIADEGLKNIPLVDLSVDDRSKFDSKVNADLRKAHVAQVMDKFEDIRVKFKSREFNRILQEQDALNLKNGYIYLQDKDKWITAAEYLDTIFPAAREKVKQIQARKKAEELARKAKVAALDNPELAASGRIDTSDEEQYRIAVKRNEDKQKAIYKDMVEGRIKPIDAAQGFRGLLWWGATQSEVAFVLSRNSDMKLSEDRRVLTITDGQPYEITFHYNDRLTMMDEHYRDLSVDDFYELFNDLQLRYGFSEEEKNSPEDQKDLLDKIVDGKLNSEQLAALYSVKKKTADDKENEDGKVVTYAFHWVGTYTIGTLSFSYSANKAADAKDEQDAMFTNIVFTKQYKPDLAASK